MQYEKYWLLQLGQQMEIRRNFFKSIFVGTVVTAELYHYVLIFIVIFRDYKS